LPGRNGNSLAGALSCPCSAKARRPSPSGAARRP
jgi:hypothetical protein